MRHSEVLAAIAMFVLCMAIYLTITTTVIGCASMFVMAQP